MLTAMGAKGIAHLADLTTTRQCRFASCLVYIDAHGVPRVFANQGRTCTVAPEPVEPLDDGAWSELWNVVIPTGCSAPLSALSAGERQRDSDRWKEQSVFRRFGDWLLSKSTPAAEPAAGGRMRSRDLTFEFPVGRIADRPRPAGTDLLLVVDRATGDISHRMFEELPEILPQHSVLVVNNSAVVRAALRRVPDDGTYLHVTSPFRTELIGVQCLCPWKPLLPSWFGPANMSDQTILLENHLSVIQDGRIATFRTTAYTRYNARGLAVVSADRQAILARRTADPTRHRRPGTVDQIARQQVVNQEQARVITDFLEIPLLLVENADLAAAVATFVRWAEGLAA